MTALTGILMSIMMAGFSYGLYLLAMIKTRAHLVTHLDLIIQQRMMILHLEAALISKGVLTVSQMAMNAETMQ